MKIILKLSHEIYLDVAHPALKNIGYSLGQIASALKIATLPFAMGGETADIILEKYQKFLSESYKKVPKDDFISSDPSISFPIIQNVQNVFNKKSIYEMYSNLLATASNQNIYQNAHPSFPTIISQMDTIDVIVLEQLRKNGFLPFIESKVSYEFMPSVSMPAVEPFCLIPNQENNYIGISSSIQNLSRLGLIHKGTAIVSPLNIDPYEKIYNSEVFASIRLLKEKMSQEHLCPQHASLDVIHGSFFPTTLGQRFLSACSTQSEAVQADH